MIHFPYYAANIRNSYPLGAVSLYQFMDAIRKPKPHIIDTFDKIRQAELDGDMAKKAELKEKLYSFTPCVNILGSRKYANITTFTGLMVLDFDHLTPDYAKEFKYFLFNDYDFIIAAWLSASKCGVRALVNIPVAQSVDEFKSYFHGLMVSEMNQYNGFDKAPQNPVLPLFLSYDPELLCADTPSIWDTKYIPSPQPPPPQYKYSANPPKVELWLKKKIDLIHDNGHPQLRAAAFSLGGFVGSGYIDHQDAIQLINNMIDGNAYLNPPAKNGYKKSSIYKKTASEMIEKGIQKPLYL